MAGLTRKDNKPRLQNLDAMFGLSDAKTQSNSIVSVDIEKLMSFKTHPFRLYEGERLEDMVASIASNGVLVPIIVRRIDENLEILSGHNRVNASKLAGLNEVPAIILESVSDEESMIYVVETNLLQRSFSDMTHTEKATVISLHHSKMFSQGKRNDILEQIKMLEEAGEHTENETYSQVANKRKSITKVGQQYGLSKDTVARYLRIQKLIPGLKLKLDNNYFAFIPAVTLSYLKEEEQELLNDCMEYSGLSVDMKKADMLRKFSEDGKLNSENIYSILSGEIVSKANRVQAIKLSDAVYSKYFNSNQSAKEIQDVVEDALALYFQLHPEFL